MMILNRNFRNHLLGVVLGVVLVSHLVSACPAWAETGKQTAEQIAKLAGVGEDEKALALCNQWLATHPDDSNILLRRSELLSTNHRFEQALADINKAIKLAPDNSGCYAVRAAINAQARKLPEAEKDYARAVQLDPKDIVLRRDRGKFYIGMKAYDKAAVDYGQAIDLEQKRSVDSGKARLTTTMWQDFNGRGRCNLELKQFQKAVDDFTIVLRLRFGYPEALKMRARAYQGLGKMDAAKKDLQAANQVIDDFAPPANLGN